MSDADAAFTERMMIAGDLGQYLTEHIWGLYRALHIGNGDFEVVGCEDVPGYEDDDEAVLLRRKSDGQVFEVDIDVDVQRALTLEQREERKHRARQLAGQMVLPGVQS